VDRIEALEAHLAQVPLFAELPQHQRSVIAQLAKRVEVPAGGLLTREGDEGHEFMMVLEGELDVRHGDRLVATLRPGSFLGEIALLDHRPRTATVTATTPAVVEVIGRSGFALALAQAPELSEQLLAVMARRLAELDRSEDTGAIPD
jgi:CRP-like cAMP-binding protein